MGGLNNKKLWFFGDSFCAHRQNWVTYVQNHYKYEEVLNHGNPGTPPVVAIRDLLDNFINISESDGVVFCISEPMRISFKRKSMPNIGHLYKNKEEDMKNFDLTENEWISLKFFMENLFTYDDWDIFGVSSILFLIEHLLKNLKTKKVVYLFSFQKKSQKGYGILNSGYRNILDFKYSKYPPLWDVFYNYGMKLYNSEDTIIKKTNITPNHWIEDGDFWNESFFPTYKPILDKLK